MVKDRLFMDNIGKCGWKSFWHVLKFCSDICFEGIRKLWRA